MGERIVYFGNKIPLEDFCDDQKRADALERGVEIVSQIEGVIVGKRVDNACAVVVQVTDETIEKLRSVLQQNNYAMSGDAKERIVKGATS